MIKGGNATIFVSDMDRSVQFYTETLKLGLHYRAGNDWAQVDAGDGLMLGLHPVGAHTPAAGGAGGIQIGLNVTRPLEEVVKNLALRGVKFEGPIRDDGGGVRLAFFNDPDGNVVYLCQYTPH